MKKASFLTIIFFLTIFNLPVQADNKSWFTGAFAFHSVRSNMTDAASPFGAGINMGYQVRFRFLRIFHLEYDYNLTRMEGEGVDLNQSPEKIVREPRHAFSLSVDIAYTPVGTTYLLAGAGKGETTENYQGLVYFGGVGIEVPFGNNWALATEARLVVPAVNEVETYLEKKYKNKVGGTPANSISDFYNSNNYQIIFALRYYY
ncbi:MAG: hypothetical protein PF689_02895 [Deltaproteobacteria bacterium]|jgi:hypothetical protein|nr:hypothetical protein [Deltaproteobacteria bacterium]